VAKELNLGAYLYLSRGEEKSKGRHKNYILANTTEALIGAIYLDQGFEVAQEFVKTFILVHLDQILEEGLHEDAKSKFQEQAQAELGITPSYEVISSEGPDHEKVFEVGAYLGEELIGKGQGSSKQKAEDAAANSALINKGWSEPEELKD
jgi:ribonuclease III